MLKTKFGKKLFSLLLVLGCVFALMGCQTDPSEAAIADAEAKAQEIHDQLIWDKTAMSQITANVRGFITKTKYSNVKVAWESSQPDVLATDGTVTRPDFDDPRAVVVKEATETESAVKAVPVTMTATITAVAEWEKDGQAYEKEIVLTKEFDFTVATVAEGTAAGTIADIKAAAYQYIYEEQGVQKALVSNSSVVYNASVTGVVTAILKASGAGQFMIHDGTEGIYVYKSLEGLEVGDKVSVVGEIYSYYGSLQFGSNLSVSIVEKAAGLDAEYRSTTPQELEEEGAELLEDGVSLAKAGYYGGELVEVYGLVVAEAAPGGSSDKYHIADAKTGEKLWIYYKSYDADMEATLQSYVGKYVNVTGVSYDRDSRMNKNEILWDGGIEEAAAPTLTDAEKVTVALAAVTLPEQVDADFELVAGEGYAWEVVSGSAIVIEGNTAKVTKGEAEDVVTLKVTVTIGSASDSKEIQVKVPAAKLNIITIAEAIELGGTTKNQYTTDKYYIQGTVKEVQNTTYGNIVIEDATGSILVYGTYSADGSTRYDALEAQPKVGDIVTVYGILGYYNDSQMKNGWIVEFYDVVTVAEAKELGGTTKNQYTEEKYALVGTVKEVQNTTYGNIVIEDATGSILIYGTYSADGEVRYDKLENQPKVGDVVTVYGILGYYNDSQMKNGWILAVAAGSGETPHEHNYVEGKCECGAEDPNYTPEQGDVTYVTNPETGVAYYLVLAQNNLGKNLYINGKMDGYYYATVETAAEAVQVYLEATDGGYHMYFLTGETKTYLNVVLSGTYKNVKYEAAPSSVWTFNTELGTLTTEVSGSAVYLGTYNTFKTFSASTLDKAPTSFVSHLYKEAPEYAAPAHEHTACATCGLCTDAECDGEAAEKCEGHTVEVPEGTAVATFTFGDNAAEAKHVDGTDLGTSKTYTDNGYDLALTDLYKVYGPAYDAKGNSCIKLGTGSVAAKLSFTVAEDVTSVVIYVAQYKSNTTKITVNGTEYSIATASNNGEYTAITIDTTTTKTVSLETVSGALRCMINTVEFYK